jgi:hypothetical protein
MARKKTDKAKKPAKRAPEPEADVLEEVDTGGAGIDEGIIFTTFALLAGAVYLIYTLLNDRYPDQIL